MRERYAHLQSGRGDDRLPVEGLIADHDDIDDFRRLLLLRAGKAAGRERKRRRKGEMRTNSFGDTRHQG